MSVVAHRFVSVDGLEVFYREAGRPERPTVLLLHGFPSSSIQFRYMLRELSDDWHLVAPDLPGFGWTRFDHNTRYAFSFDGLAGTIDRFIQTLRLDVCAVYLHDYGAQAGFRLLTRGALSPLAVIIQNAEAFQDIGWHEPMRGIERRSSEPPLEARERLRKELLNEAGVRREFVEDLPRELAERIDPAVIELGWRKMEDPRVVDAMLDLHMDYGSNIAHYPRIQAFLRETATPVLVLWGTRDQYLSPDAARAYQSERPNIELRLFDGGHWLLETHPTDVNAAVRAFLSQSS